CIPPAGDDPPAAAVGKVRERSRGPARATPALPASPSSTPPGRSRHG
ncbi:MAG: hypothetical protein AVDCRST_MAG19-3736, partial [uncultured Thermomicrobiales bacterium]